MRSGVNFGVVVGSILFLISTTVLGGSLDPSFEEKLSNMDPQDIVSAIVMMAQQTNIDSLDDYLESIGASRQLRHETVVNNLKDMAQSTQPPFLDYLDQQIAAGSVTEYKSFWIANLVSITGTVTEIQIIADREDVDVVYENSEIFLQICKIMQNRDCMPSLLMPSGVRELLVKG